MTDYRVSFTDEWFSVIRIEVSLLVVDFCWILWRCLLAENSTMAMLRYDRYRSVLLRFCYRDNNIVLTIQWDIQISIKKRITDVYCWVIVNGISFSLMLKYRIFVTMLRIDFEHLLDTLMSQSRYEYIKRVMIIIIHETVWKLPGWLLRYENTKSMVYFGKNTKKTRCKSLFLQFTNFARCFRTVTAADSRGMIYQKNRI